MIKCLEFILAISIYHKGPWCEENPLDYLTEIQMPVTKNS
jgi:hypothetical protein